jgi:hypothetical protein
MPVISQRALVQRKYSSSCEAGFITATIILRESETRCLARWTSSHVFTQPLSSPFETLSPIYQTIRRYITNMERVFVATDYESIMVNSLSYRLTILSSYFTMRMETVEISETSVTQSRFVMCLYSAIRRTLQRIAVKKSCLVYLKETGLNAEVGVECSSML